jgi:hypothetical protein
MIQDDAVDTYRAQTWIEPASDVEVLRRALSAACSPIPSTKGMSPKERAQRLHAEMERRIAAGRLVLHGGSAAQQGTE